MKTRIIKVLKANGEQKFYVQHKGLFWWITDSEEEFCITGFSLGSFDIAFNSEDEARLYIKNTYGKDKILEIIT